MLVEFECPKCKGHIYERWGFNGSNLGIRLMYWHMILNPGLAFNELVLGQRQPQQAYVCKSCTSPLADRSYFHCSNCDVFHPVRIWTEKKAFGHWLGYVCPSCGAPIPCLWNLTSLLLLGLTASFWWLPVKLSRAKWLGQQYRKIAQAKSVHTNQELKTPKPIDYYRMGWLWGTWMFVTSTLLFPAIFLLAIGQFEWSSLIKLMIITGLSGLVVWPIGGLLWAHYVKLTAEQKGDETLHLTFDANGTIVSSDFLSRLDDRAVEEKKLSGEG